MTTPIPAHASTDTDIRRRRHITVTGELIGVIPVAGRIQLVIETTADQTVEVHR